MNSANLSYFRIPDSRKTNYLPWVTASYVGWVEASLFDSFTPNQKSDPEQLFASRDMEIVRDKRNVTARLFINERQIWVKRFRPSRFRDRIVYAMKAGKSVYAWNAAMTLIERGLCTPEPLIGLRRSGWKGGADGIIAFEDVGDHSSLRELLSGDVSTPADRDQLMNEFGHCLRRFHDLGFRHRDLRQGNILIRDTKGSRSFYFLDLNRLRVQPSLTEIQRLREVEKLELPVSGLDAFFLAYMPEHDSGEMVKTYRDRVRHAERLEHLPLGRLIRKVWYYLWELRAFARARRP